MRVVVITGSRDWRSAGARPIAKVIQGADLVMHGGARGADEIAEHTAAYLHIDTLVMRAKWSKSGKRAGVERNERMAIHAARMLAQGRDVECFAFPLGDSRGTRDCIERMRKHGVKTTVFGEG